VPFPPWLIGQLGHPRGLFGRLLAAGLNRGNLPLNLHMVGALELEPGAEVLEVGFGGGVGLDLILRHAPDARVTGVERAADMISLARRRFAADLRSGRLTLTEASVDHLPFPAAHFDAACTANCVYFWPDLDAGLRELARVLRPGAILILAVNDPSVLIAAGFAARGLNTLHPHELAARMRGAGFADAHARRMPDPGRHGTSLVLGRRDPLH
jgi:arsenite methyltransferase